MNTGPSLALSPISPVVFEDGLGQRRQMVAGGSQQLTVLILHEQLAAVPAFDAALRERIGHLAGFQHRSFARVRGIAHLPSNPSSLALASDYVPGVRLSEILALAEQRLIPLEFDAALCLIRQLVPAVAALQESVPGVCHGALAPERIIITREARVVLVEHVLGAALEQLQFSHERYWKELRIPLPLTDGPPRFDPRADVTQLGALALALILGRPLADDEYPARIANIVEGVSAISAHGLEPLPTGVHSWLCRALQLDSRQSFATASEALVELDGIDGADSNRGQQALESFLAQCYAARMASNRASGSVAASIVPPRRMDPAPELRADRPTVTADTPLPRIYPAPELRADRPIVTADTPLPRIYPAPELRADQPIVTADTPLPRIDPSPELRADRPTVTAETPTVRINRAPELRADRPTVVADTPTPRIEPAPELRSDWPAVTADTPAPRLDPAPEPAAEWPMADLSPTRIDRSLARAKPTGTGDTPVPRIDPALRADRPMADLSPTRIDRSLARAARPAVAADEPAPIQVAPATAMFEPARFEPSTWTPSKDADTSSQKAAKEPEALTQHRSVAQRGRWIAAAAVLIALTSGVTLAARWYMKPEPTGTLVVNTNPSGVPVAIDGEARGSTPLTVALMPGTHVLEIATQGQVRKIPVTISEGGQVAQFIELSSDVPPVPVTGQLQVRTEPAGATVAVDGTTRGVAPLTLEDLTPGVHSVTLESALGKVTQQVTIVAGATASLVVPLGGPQGAPVSGWISIAAPVDVQVYENQRLIGSNGSDRIMVSAGPHDLTIVNEALGYRSSRTVQVKPGAVSPIRLEWPNGSLALNALPWAEVWVDGERLGETPIGSVMVPIGPHDVLFRHPELGEQAHKVMVTLTAPARVSADLRK